ncbi:hypothetical protein EMPG_12082 [Blastomyces silverae]|uniref:Uncharacterized protein n=1 Tax=Blastomyces silverae TaxID=2060906 RepID=A0A0H1BN56_9EURO|nr:hypothetical protein EMPG_12082 [Blastomyces silverae]
MRLKGCVCNGRMKWRTSNNWLMPRNWCLLLQDSRMSWPRSTQKRTIKLQVFSRRLNACVGRQQRQL